MAVITFSNGVKVNFDGNPSESDIQTVAQKVGIMNTQAPSQPQGLQQAVLAGNANTRSQVRNAVSGAFNAGVDQIKQSYQQAKTAPSLLAKGEAGLGMLAGGANALMAPLAPVLAPITAPINASINAAANKVSDIPAVQKFAQTPAGLTTSRVAQDVSNTATVLPFLAGALAPKQVLSEAGAVVDNGLNRVSNALTKTPEEIAAANTEKFNSNLNKAIPVLKKDVKDLAGKQKSAQTAFQDIVSNKDTLGLVDEEGAPRFPENFTETAGVQQQRLGQIYKDYTAKLSTVDKPRFEQDIHSQIFKQIDDLNNALKKENSVDGRRALTKIRGELSSLRDLSPEGIQNYIESINQRTRVAPGHPPTAEQIKLANLGGEMRKLLDTSISKLNGPGYQQLRNTYGAHKALESQLLQAAKKEINNTPGFTDKITSLGITAEGLNFLLTHDPHALLIAGGIKGATAFTKWLNSPQRALRNIFNDLEAQSKNPAPLSPSQMK